MKRYTLLFLILVWFANISNAFAMPSALQISNSQSSYSLADHMEILRDRGGSLDIDKLSLPEHSSKFSKVSSKSIRPDPLDAATWLRFTIYDSSIVGSSTVGKKNTNAPQWLLKSSWPYIHKITLYTPDGSDGTNGLSGTDGWLVKSSGLYNSWSKEYGLDKFIALKLLNPGKEPLTYYVKIEVWEEMPITFEVCTLDNLLTKARLTSLTQGLFYGILIAMIIYNLVLWFSMKQSAYLWYVLSGVFLGIYFSGFNGLYYQFWPQLSGPWFYPPFLFCWLSASSIFMILFARSFLFTKLFAPWIDKMLLICLASWVAGIIITFKASESFIVAYFTYAGMSFSIVIFLAALACWRKKFQPALMFLIAWSCACTGSVWLSLTLSGAVPYTPYGFYALQTGTALEMILFSLALSQRVRALHQEKELFESKKTYYKKLSYKDGLTGLFNKRWLLENLESKLNESLISESPLAVAMFDVDNFKYFNDTYGHPAGDQVLIRLARVMKSCLREGDRACRYGGEEFTIMLPGVSNQTALEVIERIRKKLEAEEFNPVEDRIVRVTTSIGIANIAPGDSVQELLHRADNALYEAKSRGKNQTVIA